MKIDQLEQQTSNVVQQSGAGETAKKCSFVIAMKYFFGQLPGQSLKDFNDELKALTLADRTELTALLQATGQYEITNPQTA